MNQISQPVILKYIVILNNKKHTNPTFEKDLERFLANGVPIKFIRLIFLKILRLLHPPKERWFPRRGSMNTKQTAVMQFAITSDIVVQKSILTTSFILIQSHRKQHFSANFGISIRPMSIACELNIIFISKLN